MTPNAIISEALELQGNTGLTARAQVWLNRLIEALAYLNKGIPNTWNYKETSVTLAGSTRTYALPSPVPIFVTDQAEYIDATSSERSPVTRRGYPMLEAIGDATTGTGDPPIHFALDNINSLWVVWPVPTKAGTLKIWYWNRPVDINFTTGGASELTGSFPFHGLLVEAVANMAVMHQADDAAFDFEALAQKVHKDAARRNHDHLAGRKVLRPDPTVFALVRE